MNPEDEYSMHMQGGGQKESEKCPPSPPPPAPERRKDIPAYDPEPLTESEPPPNQIEPDEGWDRE